MADSKDLLQVLWSGADELRGKMDANEYKTYLLGLVFYKYLSDSYLAKVYDLLNDATPESLDEAQEQYEEVMKTDDAEDLLAELRQSMHYTLDPDMTYVSMLNDAKDNRFNREKLQAAFNRIQESDELFNGLFADVDLYSNRLGTGDQKQSATIANVIKVLDGADLIHAEGDVLVVFPRNFIRIGVVDVVQLAFVRAVYLHAFREQRVQPQDVIPAVPHDLRV